MLFIEDFLKQKQAAVVEAKRNNTDREKRKKLLKAVAELVKLIDATNDDLTALIRQLQILRVRR